MGKKTLLERYDIPISHLDFQYVKTCNNAREIEKIVAILRSNEEGYFPDLTKCAENKLRELKPNSFLLRYEEAVKTRDHLSAEELQPIFDMTNDLKQKDIILENLIRDEKIKNEIIEQQPIRKCGKITKPEDEKSEEKKSSSPESQAMTEQRIKATDYRSWDKYDADAEILKIELDEEREKEQLEIKNRLTQKKYQQKPKIEEVKDEEKENLVKKLTELEKEKLAENYRLRGNDYFREKDFQSSLEEYAKAIKLYPPAAATCHNNRAAAFLKLKKFPEAIEECKKCLEMEPKNIKALIRLADASSHSDRKREAQEILKKVLKIDENNSIALKNLEKLNKELGELPPVNATRLTIEECKSLDKKTPVQEKEKKENVVKMEEKPKVEKIKDYDFAELVKPNKITQNLPNIPKPPARSPPKKPEAEKSPPSDTTLPVLQLPSNAKKPITKTLIQEI